MSDVVRAPETEPGVPGRTKGQRVPRSYALSLMWVALTFAVLVGVSNITELVFVDFVHGNPYRTKANAVEMMWLFTLHGRTRSRGRAS